MTPEQTAQRVKQRLTETPEQRREREIQEFMTAHGYDRLELVGKDGSRRIVLSPEAAQREAAEREVERRMFQQRAEIQRQLEEAKRRLDEQEEQRVTWTDRVTPNRVWQFP
jgi:hypothetical protein